MPLRRHLVILAALTILPLVVFSAWIVYELHQEARGRVERSLTDTARALSLALDREIIAMVSALEALGTSDDIDRTDLRAFYNQAQSLLTKQKAWTTVILTDPAGAPRLNTLYPLGTRVPPLSADPEDLRRVTSTLTPVVSAAFVRPGSDPGTWFLDILVPVARQGRVRSILAVAIETRSLRDILVQQKLPAEWIGTILDTRRVIIARTRAEEQFVGQPASQPLLEASARSAEGWYRGLTKEGTHTYSAFSRSSLTGLTVALGAPAEPIDAVLRRPLWGIGGAGALFLALGIVIAVFFARRIADPIAALAAGAHQIGRGAEPPAPRTSIAEVAALGQAMQEAARLVRDERETLETINRTGQMLAGELSLERLVQGVTDASTRLCRAAFGAFFYNLADQHGESYTLYAISGVPREAFANFPMPRNTDLFGPTFRGEGVVRIDDVTRDPRYGRSAPYHGMPPGHLPVRSYLAVSVVSRTGEVLGGLFFGHPDAGVFTPREEEIVLGLAPQIATAIDNARLYERQQTARAEAEAANTLKDEFLATLSHELRTPLNAVLGWTRMLRDGILDAPTAKRALEVIDRNADAQRQLIEDLLDVSRIVTGKMRLDVGPVEPITVVEAAIDAVRPAAEAKAIRLQSVLDPRAGPVSGDPDRLQQVVWNLLSNSIKFTPRERAGAGPAGAGELPRRDRGDRLRPGHRRRRAPPRLRAVPPGRERQSAQSRRIGHRSGAGQTARGAARGLGRGGQRRRRPGCDVHRQAPADAARRGGPPTAGGAWASGGHGLHLAGRRPAAGRGRRRRRPRPVRARPPPGGRRGESRAVGPRGPPGPRDVGARRHRLGYRDARRERLHLHPEAARRPNSSR